MGIDPCLETFRKFTCVIIDHILPAVSVFGKVAVQRGVVRNAVGSHKGTGPLQIAEKFFQGLQGLFDGGDPAEINRICRTPFEKNTFNAAVNKMMKVRDFKPLSITLAGTLLNITHKKMNTSKGIKATTFLATKVATINTITKKSFTLGSRV